MTLGLVPARRAAAVPVAAMSANVASYALLLVAAHALSKADYGRLSSLLTLLLIASVPQLAVQTVAARRAATRDRTDMVRVAMWVGAAVTAVLLVLTPALSAFLHMHNPIGLVLAASCALPMTVIGAPMGLAQGTRHFHRLAALLLLAIGVRSLGGLVGVVIGRSPEAALAGALAGAVVGTGVALALERAERAAMLRGTERPHPRAALVEVLHAVHGHGAFLVLTSLDVLLARHVLSADDAGAYAVGSVVARAALWLPQSVVMLLFASLADHAAHRSTVRRASLILTGLGTLVVAGCAALGPLVVVVVGGSKYHALDHDVWRFAVLGLLLSLIQLGMMAGLAQRQVRRILLIWLTAGADVVLVLAFAGSTVAVVSIVTIVAAIATAVTLAVLWRQAAPASGQG